jgi:hypothetical protein
LHRDCFLGPVVEGKVEGYRRRGGRRKQLLDPSVRNKILDFERERNNFVLYGELATAESMSQPQDKQSSELRTTHFPGPAHMSEFEERCSYPWGKQ